MRIEAVSEALLDEARQEAEAIVRKARFEANKAIESEKIELAKRRDEEIAAYKRTIEKMVEERIAAARLDAKKEVQKAKDAVASKVVEALLEKLIWLRKEKAEYNGVLTSFYKKAAQELRGALEDEGGRPIMLEVECAKDDVAIVKKIIRKGDTVKATPEIDGGIIVKDKKGSVIIDMTFRTIVKDRESEIKAKVYRKLFK